MQLERVGLPVEKLHAVVVVVVLDGHSRQHVKHRSNQEVGAEEVFSFAEIPRNPHTHPTMTAIGFSWKRKKESEGKCGGNF